MMLQYSVLFYELLMETEFYSCCFVNYDRRDSATMT